MSKCLEQEALAYFDECVSISTFEDSDFSSPEDLPSNMVSIDGLSHERLGSRFSGVPSRAIDSYSIETQVCFYSLLMHAPLPCLLRVLSFFFVQITEARITKLCPVSHFEPFLLKPYGNKVRNIKWTFLIRIKKKKLSFYDFSTIISTLGGIFLE